MAILEQFAQGAMYISLIMMAVIVVGGIFVGLTYLVLHTKRFSEYVCIIWETNGFGQISQSFDSAGIFVDKKTNNKRFYLKKAKVGLTPDNVPYIPCGSKKYVFLYRFGLKNFAFIKPNITPNAVKFSVGEEDVNWAINSYEGAKKLFKFDTLLQFMPYIMLAFTTVAILIIFIYFFKNFNTLQQVADSLYKAAQAMSAANAGTTIIPT